MLMLLECLHHDPNEVQHFQQCGESLLAEDAALFLFLKDTYGTTKHRTRLGAQKNTHLLIFCVLV